MDFAGRYVIPAPPDAVWTALNDSEVLKNCIPGCQEMEKTDPTHFRASVTLKIGPVKATFKGTVALENLDPPHRATLRGEGQGGVAGFAKGEAEILLVQEDKNTVLTYNAKANIGGKLAQIGQRLIDGAAKQIADDFFGRFSTAVGVAFASSAEPSGEATLDPAVPVVLATENSDPMPITPSQSVKREGAAPEIWVVGLVAIIIILLVLFGIAL